MTTLPALKQKDIYNKFMTTMPELKQKDAR